MLATLADVLPAAAGALGFALGEPGLKLPVARQVVVVLVDGLGEELLARRSGHAPFLRALRAGTVDGAPAAIVARCGYPSTTATSLGMFGTGLPPGSHGLVGVDVLDPERGVLFSELSWDASVDPRRWQPRRTVFELLAAAGVEVVRIGPAYFDGSGLTEAALRGGRFIAAAQLAARVDVAVRVVRAATGPCLAYLYWGQLDKVGHVHGCQSWQWGEELAAVDAALAELVERVGPDTLVVVTADHGMVDVPFDQRLDVAHEPDLAAGVRHLGGEGRALHLYCEPGAAIDVLARWQERLRGRMEVRSRDEAVALGWFGRVEDRVLPRIGDVVSSATDTFAVFDSRTARPEVLRLIGMHGARTSAEQLVPVLATYGSGR